MRGAGLEEQGGVCTHVRQKNRSLHFFISFSLNPETRSRGRHSPSSAKAMCRRMGLPMAAVARETRDSRRGADRHREVNVTLISLK